MRPALDGSWRKHPIWQTRALSKNWSSTCPDCDPNQFLEGVYVEPEVALI
jgi:hypothetical protein